MAFNLTANLNVALNTGSLKTAMNQINSSLGSTSTLKIGVDPKSSGIARLKPQITEATDAVENFGRQAGLAAKRFAAFSITAGSIMSFVSSIKEAVSAAISFDREMVRLAQVSSDSIADVGRVGDEITRLSKSYGVSSKDLIGVAVTLKQANLTLKETKDALEAMAQAALAPNFDNIKDTTEGAIAIMKQFNVESKNLGAALGSLNAVAGEFAVEAGDLVEAVRKTGGAFKAAGGDLNQLLALFTSIRQTTRESAETISTGLRTIFTRIQRNDTVEALKQLGIQLRYTRQEAASMGDLGLENQFIGPYEAVKRLAEGLNQLRSTDPRFSAIVEELGGYRQISKVIPLIKEFGTAQKALGVAQAGQASLAINAGQAQDALAVKLQKLKERFAEVGRSILNSPGFKSLVDIFISGSNAVLRLVDSLKGLIPLITAVSAVKIGANLGKFGAGLFTGFTSNNIDQTRQPSTLNYKAVAPRKYSGGFLRMKNGGVVPGSGSGDIVPALLEPGEVVVPKNKVVRKAYKEGAWVTLQTLGKNKDTSSINTLIKKDEKEENVLNKKDLVRMIVMNKPQRNLTLKQKEKIYKGKARLSDEDVKLYSDPNIRSLIYRSDNKKNKESIQEEIVKKDYNFNIEDLQKAKKRVASAEAIWGKRFERIVINRKKRTIQAATRPEGVAESTYPVDTETIKGEKIYGDVKFKTSKEEYNDLLSKQLRAKLYQAGSPRRLGFTDKVGDKIDLGGFQYYSSYNTKKGLGAKGDFLESLSDLHERTKPKQANLGGQIQKLAFGGSASGSGITFKELMGMAGSRLKSLKNKIYLGGLGLAGAIGAGSAIASVHGGFDPVTSAGLDAASMMLIGSSLALTENLLWPGKDYSKEEIEAIRKMLKNAKEASTRKSMLNELDRLENQSGLSSEAREVFAGVRRRVNEESQISPEDEKNAQRILQAARRRKNSPKPVKSTPATPPTPPTTTKPVITPTNETVKPKYTLAQAREIAAQHLRDNPNKQSVKFRFAGQRYNLARKEKPVIGPEKPKYTLDQAREIAAQHLRDNPDKESVKFRFAGQQYNLARKVKPVVTPPVPSAPMSRAERKAQATRELAERTEANRIRKENSRNLYIQREQERIEREKQDYTNRRTKSLFSKAYGQDYNAFDDIELADVLFKRKETLPSLGFNEQTNLAINPLAARIRGKQEYDTLLQIGKGYGEQFSTAVTAKQVAAMRKSTSEKRKKQKTIDFGSYFPASSIEEQIQTGTQKINTEVQKLKEIKKEVGNPYNPNPISSRPDITAKRNRLLAERAKAKQLEEQAQIAQANEAEKRRKAAEIAIKNQMALGLDIRSIQRERFGFASGGLVPGTGNSDTVPMNLPEGSFVIRKSSVNKIGADRLAKMGRFASGGSVPALLTPGEYVFSPNEASRIGSAKLHQMNSFARFKNGGKVGRSIIDPTLLNDPKNLKKILQTLITQIAEENPNLTDKQAKKQAKSTLNDIKLNFATLEQSTKDVATADTGLKAAGSSIERFQNIFNRANKAVGSLESDLNKIKQNVDRKNKELTGTRTDISRAESQKNILQVRRSAALAAGKNTAVIDAQITAKNTEILNLKTQEANTIKEISKLQRDEKDKQAKITAKVKERDAAEKDIVAAQQKQAKYQSDKDKALETGRKAAASYQVGPDGKIITASGRAVGDRGPIKGTLQTILNKQLSESGLGQKSKELISSRAQSSLAEQIFNQRKVLARARGQSFDAELEAAKAEDMAASSAAGKRKVVRDKKGNVIGDKKLAQELKDLGYSETGSPRSLGTMFGSLGRGILRTATFGKFGSNEPKQQLSPEENRLRKLENRQNMAFYGQAAMQSVAGGLVFLGGAQRQSAGSAESVLSGGQFGKLAEENIRASEGFRSKYQTAGALEKAGTFAGGFAALGGTIGTAFGPIGTLVGAGLGAALGAVTGAIEGSITGLQEAEAQIRQAKLGNALNTLQSVFEKVSNGLVDVNDSTINSIRTAQQRIAELSSQEAFAGAGGEQTAMQLLFSGRLSDAFNAFNGKQNAGFNVKEFNALIEKNRSQNLASQLVPLTNILNKTAEKIGREAFTSVNAVNPQQAQNLEFKNLRENLLGSLREGNAGFNKEQIQNIARIRNLDVKDIEEELLRVVEESFKASKISKAQEQAVVAIERNINSMQMLSNAVQAASISVQSYNSVLESNSAMFEGRISSTRLNPLGAQFDLSPNPDREAFSQSLKTISSSLGNYGKTFSAQGEAINAASELLPTILSQTLANPISGEDVGTQITDALRKALSARGINDQQASTLINSVGGNIAGQDYTKFLAEAGGDVSKAAEKLLANIKDPFINAGKQIAQELDNAANQFINGLTDLANRQKQIGVEVDKVNQLKLQKDRFQADLMAKSAGLPSAGIDLLSLDTLTRPFDKRQEKLTGFYSTSALNPDAIAAKLQSVQEKQIQKENQLKQTDRGADGGAAFRQTAEELNNLKLEASNLQEALRNLADQSTKVGAIQEKLGRLQEARQTSLNIGRRLVTGGPEERLKFAQGQQLYNIANAQNLDIRNFNDAQAQALFEFLDNFGQTGKDIQDKILGNLGFGLTGSQQRQENDLNAQLAKVFDDQVRAQQRIVENQKGLQTDYFNTLKAQNADFFAKMDKFLAQMEKTGLENQRAREQQKQLKIQDVGQQSKFLSDAGVTTKEDMAFINKNRGLIGDVLTNNRTQLTQVKNLSNIQELLKPGNLGAFQSIQNIIGGTQGAEAAKVVGSNRDFIERQIMSKTGITDNATIKQIVDNLTENLAQGKDFTSAIAETLQQAAANINAQMVKATQELADRGANNKLIQDVVAQAEANNLTAKSVNMAIDAVNNLNLGIGVDLTDAAQIAQQNIQALDAQIRNLGNNAIQNQAAPVRPQAPVNPLAARGDAGFFDFKDDGGTLFPKRGTDVVPAMLTPGEFIVNRESASKNLPLLRAINSSKTSYLANGGVAGLFPDQRLVSIAATNISATKDEALKTKYKNLITKEDNVIQVLMDDKTNDEQKNENIKNIFRNQFNKYNDLTSQEFDNNKKGNKQEIFNAFVNKDNPTVNKSALMNAMFQASEFEKAFSEKETLTQTLANKYNDAIKGFNEKAVLSEVIKNKTGDDYYKNLLSSYSRYKILLNDYPRQALSVPEKPELGGLANVNYSAKGGSILFPIMGGGYLTKDIIDSNLLNSNQPPKSIVSYEPRYAEGVDWKNASKYINNIVNYRLKDPNELNIDKTEISQYQQFNRFIDDQIRFIVNQEESLYDGFDEDLYKKLETGSLDLQQKRINIRNTAKTFANPNVTNLGRFFSEYSKSFSERLKNYSMNILGANFSQEEFDSLDIIKENNKTKFSNQVKNYISNIDGNKLNTKEAKAFLNAKQENSLSNYVKEILFAKSVIDQLNVDENRVKAQKADADTGFDRNQLDLENENEQKIQALMQKPVRNPQEENELRIRKDRKEFLRRKTLFASDISGNFDFGTTGQFRKDLRTTVANIKPDANLDDLKNAGGVQGLLNRERYAQFALGKLAENTTLNAYAARRKIKQDAAFNELIQIGSGELNAIINGGNSPRGLNKGTWDQANSINDNEKNIIGTYLREYAYQRSISLSGPALSAFLKSWNQVEANAVFQKPPAEVKGLAAVPQLYSEYKEGEKRAFQVLKQKLGELGVQDVDRVADALGRSNVPISDRLEAAKRRRLKLETKTANYAVQSINNLGEGGYSVTYNGKRFIIDEDKTALEDWTSDIPIGSKRSVDRYGSISQLFNQQEFALYRAATQDQEFISLPVITRELAKLQQIFGSLQNYKGGEYVDLSNYIFNRKEVISSEDEKVSFNTSFGTGIFGLFNKKNQKGRKAFGASNPVQIRSPKDGMYVGTYLGTKENIENAINEYGGFLNITSQDQLVKEKNKKTGLEETKKIKKYILNKAHYSTLGAEKTLARMSSNEDNVDNFFKEIQNYDQYLEQFLNMYSLFLKMPKQPVQPPEEPSLGLSQTGTSGQGSLENASRGGLIYRSSGGDVPSFAPNPDPSFFVPSGTDTVPAMLTPGEFVVNAQAASANRGLLQQINSGGPVYKAFGGGVYEAQSRIGKFYYDLKRKNSKGQVIDTGGYQIEPDQKYYDKANQTLGIESPWQGNLAAAAGRYANEMRLLDILKDRQEIMADIKRPGETGTIKRSLLDYFKLAFSKAGNGIKEYGGLSATQALAGTTMADLPGSQASIAIQAMQPLVEDYKNIGTVTPNITDYTESKEKDDAFMRAMEEMQNWMDNFRSNLDNYSGGGGMNMNALRNWGWNSVNKNSWDNWNWNRKQPELNKEMAQVGPKAGNQQNINFGPFQDAVKTFDGSVKTFDGSVNKFKEAVSQSSSSFNGIISTLNTLKETLDKASGIISSQNSALRDSSDNFARTISSLTSAMSTFPGTLKIEFSPVDLSIAFNVPSVVSGVTQALEGLRSDIFNQIRNMIREEIHLDEMG